MREWGEAKKFDEELVKKCMETGRWDEAEAVLRKAAGEFPYDSTVLAQLGTVLWNSGKQQEALETLEKALMLDSDDVHVIEATIKVFVAMDRRRDAEAIFTAYMDRNPWDSEAKDRLARILGRSRCDAEPMAISQLVRSNAVEEKEPESMVLLRVGEEEFARQYFDRARMCFELAYERDATNAKALNNLGVVAWQQGDVAGALEYFRKALDADPLDAEILLNSARALGDAAQWDTAADLLQLYLSRHGNDEEAWSDFRRFVQAAAVPWTPDGLPQKVADLYVEMGQKLAALEDYQGAIEAYGRALKISNDSADAYYGLGLLELNLNRTEQAAEMFRAALEIDPSHEQAGEALDKMRESGDKPTSDAPGILERSAASL